MINQQYRVQWFGSHPLEGSVSMQIYRENLLASLGVDDGFKVKCWPNKGSWVESGTKLERLFAKQVAYKKRVRNMEIVDLVHFLDHSSGYLIPQVQSGQKVVATLHDLIPLRFSGGLSKLQVDRFRQTVSHLKKCDAVISVSEYSKQEAVELLGLDEERVHVVANGVDAPSEKLTTCPFVQRLRDSGAQLVVLSIGSLQKRKNLSLLPGALRVFQKQTGVRVGLLRIGPLLDHSLSEEIRVECADGCFLEAGRLEQDSVWSAYQNCDLVFVPSFYEGFGLPVIEGLACGKGVAASGQSSLPEVGKEWAEYFDPNSAEEAGQALARLLPSVDDVEIEQKRKKAVEGMSWRSHLEGIYRVYASVLS